MENNFDFSSSSSFPSKSQTLPNATAVLVLGILSIVGCCFWGVGIIFAVIAMVLAAKSKKLYTADPMLYSDASLKNLKAGRVCAIIGLILCLIYFILLVFLLATGLYDKFQDPAYVEQMMEQYKNR